MAGTSDSDEVILLSVTCLTMSFFGNKTFSSSDSELVEDDDEETVFSFRG